MYWRQLRYCVSHEDFVTRDKQVDVKGIECQICTSGSSVFLWGPDDVESSCEWMHEALTTLLNIGIKRARSSGLSDDYTAKRGTPNKIMEFCIIWLHGQARYFDKEHGVLDYLLRRVTMNNNAIIWSRNNIRTPLHADVQVQYVPYSSMIVQLLQ
jgi:hypothetical protein